MDKINVLVVSWHKLHTGFLDEIEAVSPRISVKSGLEQFVAELRGKDNPSHFADVFGEEARRGIKWSFIHPKTEETLDALLAEAEIIYGQLIYPDNLLQRAPNLKWIHMGGTGIDKIIQTDLFDKQDIVITNARGSAAIAISEHVLTFMLGLAKRIPNLIENKQHKHWESQRSTLELRDRTVGIIGVGYVGSEVARLAKGIGMRVIGVEESAEKRESGVIGIEKMYSPEDLQLLLAESDFVVVSVPLTPRTRKMIGEPELKSMKPTAYLINCARGPIIDELALIKALKEGWIAGAGLDVFEIEPLPLHSELWNLPNVIISPHMSASSDRRSRRLIDCFCENLKRYLAGQPLINIVDKNQEF